MNRAWITMQLAVGARRQSALPGWTHTGGWDCRGRETPRMPDGSPNWALPAREPDNSPRAVAGRVLGLAAVYVFGAVMGVAGLWATHQPRSREAMARLILAMPGPGPVWQTLQALGVMAAAPVLTVLTVKRARVGLRWPRAWTAASGVGVRVQVLPTRSVRAIPAGEVVARSVDRPRLVALPERPAEPVLRDSGSVEVEGLLFRLLPPVLVLLALVNATAGDASLRRTVWPLLAGALVLAWAGHSIRRSRTEQADPPAPTGRVCDSCRQAEGTVTVIFLDGVTFVVCALCLNSGTHRQLDPHPNPDPGASVVDLRRGVQP